MAMKQILTRTALILAAAAVPVTAAAASIEGRWKNPKGSVVVAVERCGAAYCGRVVDASEKAKASARKGGTASLVGTRILTGLKPTGDGTFKGHAFDPKRNIRAPATIRLIGPNAIEVKGCAIAGMLLCKQQRWSRVG